MHREFHPVTPVYLYPISCDSLRRLCQKSLDLKTFSDGGSSPFPCNVFPMVKQPPCQKFTHLTSLCQLFFLLLLSSCSPELCSLFHWRFQRFILSQTVNSLMGSGPSHVGCNWLRSQPSDIAHILDTHSVQFHRHVFSTGIISFPSFHPTSNYCCVEM